MNEPVRIFKKTPFFAWHVQHGATMYEKGGWVRPASYSAGPVAEHLAVRATGGIVDAHSMGKVTVEGAGAERLLQFTTTGDIGGLAVGSGRYTCMCAEDGGIIDDLIVYRTAPTSYYMITNTLSRERVLDFLRGHADGTAVVHDVSSALAYIAVQGPKSRTLLEHVGVDQDLSDDALPYFGCRETRLAGVPTLLARTGYTGELGYELNFPAEYATDVWARLCEVGAPLQVSPIGAQAMMSLRLEKGYRSYGADIDASVNPIEAGLGWLVDWSKPDFSGRAALAAVKEAGPRRRAVYLRAADGVEIHRGDKLATTGEPVGEVTSGLFGPSVGAYVGLGYLDSAVPTGTPLTVSGRDGGTVECAARPFFDPTGQRLRG